MECGGGNVPIVRCGYALDSEDNFPSMEEVKEKWSIRSWKRRSKWATESGTMCLLKPKILFLEC